MHQGSRGKRSLPACLTSERSPAEPRSLRKRFQDLREQEEPFLGCGPLVPGFTLAPSSPPLMPQCWVGFSRAPPCSPVPPRAISCRPSPSPVTRCSWFPGGLPCPALKASASGSGFSEHLSSSEWWTSCTRGLGQLLPVESLLLTPAPTTWVRA